MFSSIEIIALIFVLAAVIKIVAVLISPAGWFNFEKKFFSHPRLMMWVCLILAAFVLNFLLKELTITQIFAAAAFTTLLILAGISIIGLNFIKFKESLLSKNIIRKYLWYIVLWVILIIWVLEEVFVK